MVDRSDLLLQFTGVASIVEILNGRLDEISVHRAMDFPFLLLNYDMELLKAKMYTRSRNTAVATVRKPETLVFDKIDNGCKFGEWDSRSRGITRGGED